MQSTSEAPLKKSYQPPKLEVYGDLTEMTKAKGTSPNSDHGNNHKT